MRSAAIVQTAQEMTHTSQNQREDNFYLPHPPTPGTEALQIISQPRARRADLVPGVAWGAGVVTGQIEPCITTSEVVVMYLRDQS